MGGQAPFWPKRRINRGSVWFRCCCFSQSFWHFAASRCNRHLPGGLTDQGYFRTHFAMSAFQGGANARPSVRSSIYPTVQHPQTLRECTKQTESRRRCWTSETSTSCCWLLGVGGAELMPTLASPLGFKKHFILIFTNIFYSPSQEAWLSALKHQSFVEYIAQLPNQLIIWQGFDE